MDVLTEQLVRLLRESSVLNKLRMTGAIPAKEHGSVTVDGIYRVVKCGWCGRESNELIGARERDFSRAVQEAVIEAGFATEPLRHSVTELATLLRDRMLSDPVRGFTQREWDAVQKADELAPG